jgi:L-iditol 2-dehydrogenase
MKALVYKLNIPKYLIARTMSSRFRTVSTSVFTCLSYREVPLPSPPDDEWVRVRMLLSGICGTDLSILNGKTSFSMQPYGSKVFIPGHEIVGEIVEKPPGMRNFREGDRVIVEPLHTCATRGIPEPCINCRRGQQHLCLNTMNGRFAPSAAIGFGRETGGGWGEYFIAHRSQLHKMPRQFSLEEAVLAEPFAVALHAVLRRYPPNGAKVLVLGSGTIGLLTIAALRMLPIRCKIYATARHPFQKKLASEMGAHVVVEPDKAFEYIARETRAQILKPSIGKRIMEGGVQRVYDSVGSAGTVDDALRMTQAGGSVVIIGGAGEANGVDMTPIWFREVDLTGSYAYSQEQFRGRKRRTFEYAIDLMKRNNRIPLKKLVTHKFPLREWKRGLRTAQLRGRSKSVKVVFTTA